MTSPYLTRQRDRWTRPNAHLFVRPDWRRFVPQDQNEHPFAFYENKYRPDQPRVPSGSREGGQWTADGGGGGSQPADKPPIYDPRVISDVTPDDDWRPGAQYAQGPKDEPGRSSLQGRSDGHHYVPRAVVRESGLSDEAKQVFDKAKTGRLYDVRSNQWDEAHRAYSKAVKQSLDEYLVKNGIRPETMTAGQAREFLGKVFESADPRIKSYNIGIQMREIMHRLIRRGGRE